MEKSMPIAIVAVIISVVAIASAVVLKPTVAIGAGAVGGNELADNSVTSGKIVDGTIRTEDIAEGVIAEFAIPDNSITSAKIQNGTITNVDISPTAAIALSKLATYPFGLADLAANSVDDTKIVDGSVTSTDIQDGTIQTTDMAAGALTQTAENFGTAVDTTTTVWSFLDDLDEARLMITTGNNPVLIVFSGVFSDNTAGGRVRILLDIDGGIYAHATRTGTSAAAGDPFALTFSCMPTLSAGTHTIQVKWCVMGAGQEGSAYNRVLDVIELKR